MSRIAARSPFLTALSALALLAGSTAAQTELLVKYGGSPSALAGNSVAGGADFNGDGFKDFVYGVPGADINGKTDNGSVRVVDGQTGAILATKSGANDGDRLGTSVALAGDVDNDGVIDIIAGAPFGLVGGVANGYARVYSGADFSLIHTLAGTQDGSLFGASVAGRIDPDQDGHADLLVGAPIGGFILSPEGKVYVYSGATGALLQELTGWQSSGFGWSVANAGFVDGDSSRDFIVGAPGYSNGTGRAKVFDGRNYTSLHEWSDGAMFGGFGLSVEGDLDFNGDGFDDLAAAAYQHGGGRVYFYDGLTGMQLTYFLGDQFGDQFGLDISRLGDLDGDGFDELLIGSNADYARVVSPSLGVELMTLTGVSGEGFGRAVGFAGDVDGDGIRDFLVGAPQRDNLQGESDAGAVLLYSSAPWFMNYCTAGTSASGCQAALTGSGVPSASASSGFTLQATGVEGDKSGLYFYGANGRQANTWGNSSSFQCVTPPVKRGGLLPQSGTPGGCDGVFTQDLNARWCPSCPKPNHNFGAGAVVQAQLWYRDPQNTSNQTTGLSDAIEFVLVP